MGLLVLLGAAAAVMCGTPQAISAEGKVKLAIVSEITGGGAPSGTMYRDGVLLAIDDINKAGGILGKRPRRCCAAAWRMCRKAATSSR